MGHQVLGVGITGTELTELERTILRDSPPYAVILFGRNVESVEQLRALVQEIKGLSDTPPLLMIDQEGGRVDRLRALIPGLPSAEAFLEGDEATSLSGWFGDVIGRSLQFFDIDVNLAPVVDLRGEEPAKGLERRCFGFDPETVIELAGEFIRQQHATGIATCLKHFPGMGAGSGDPHYGASVVDLPREELIASDLVPFRVLGREARAVMTGHVLYPRLDPGVPASLSPAITTDLLRREVGFEGLAISDDMEMHAVSDLGSYEEICERALCAGNDVILLCSHIEMAPRIMEHLERRAEQSASVGARFDEAVRRAEEYRAHCRELRSRATVQAGSLENILDEVRRFREAFEAARPKDGAGNPLVDRRQNPRTPGTGRTGREEWT
jgi:beta-N-acetylhexosaminidase